MIRKVKLAALLIFILLLVGCVPQAEKKSPSHKSLIANSSSSGNQAQLSVFISMREEVSLELIMEMQKMEILSSSGWIPLISKPFTLNSKDIDRQKLLARLSLPPGGYTKLRVSVDKASIVEDTATIFLGLDPNLFEYIIAAPLNLEAGDSTCLFINWESRESLANKVYLNPKFQVYPQILSLNTDLAYVSCPEINTVYIIKTDTNNVYGSFGITGYPTYLAINATENKLFVLASKQSAIKVIELSSGRMTDEIPLQMALTPSFMTYSLVNNAAYVLDEKTNYVYKVNLTNGILEAYVRFFHPLEYALFLENYDRLAVSSSYSREVSLLDPNTLEAVEVITAGEGISGLFQNDTELIIAEGTGNSIAAYNLTSGVTKRNHLNGAPKRVFLSDNSLFVTNPRTGTVSVLVSGTLNFVKNITLFGTPLEMASSSNRKWLYVTNEATGEIAVIDLVSQKVARKISLATYPAHIVVSQ